MGRGLATVLGPWAAAWRQYCASEGTYFDWRPISLSHAHLSPLLSHFRQVFNSTILQQEFVVEYIVANQNCDDCHRTAAKDHWNAVVQVRQKVDHKKTFFYIEQLIIKHRAAAKTVNIKDCADGVCVGVFAPFRVCVRDCVVVPMVWLPMHVVFGEVDQGLPCARCSPPLRHLTFGGPDRDCWGPPSPDR